MLGLKHVVLPLLDHNLLILFSVVIHQHLDLLLKLYYNVIGDLILSQLIGVVLVLV